jgi:glycosyltransferase involved in cell wall biosynthesis
MNISVLLPTRGRTASLEASVKSLIDTANDITKVQLLLAFDNDDTDSIEYFSTNIQPVIEQHKMPFTALIYEPVGYERLNEYVNSLAKHATGDWIMFWNDDAIIHTKAWDLKITEHTGKFRTLRIPTHNCHPYAVFPIVPRKWFELFGYLSAHQLSDAWISQISYMVDIVVNLDVDVTHDRFDLTGNNNDETFNNRPMLEGNPGHPKDFNFISWRNHRLGDCRKIAEYLKSQGEDISWFTNILNGTQDPWEKMVSPEYDPNQQIKRINKENFL